MTRPDHESYCAEIVEQTRLLRLAIAGADLEARVPSCPDWTLYELVVHVGGAHRWAAEIVRTRATEEVDEEGVPGFAGPVTAGPEALDRWLAEGAELVADALREAGAAERVWTWAPEQKAGFWARRMTHETVIHRADACQAAKSDFTVTPGTAADCIDEWLDILTADESWAEDEELRELAGRAGDSLHLHATDANAEWLIELGTDGVDWRHAHGKATVALRGPLTDVLLVFYRRLPADSGRVEVLGDAGLLGHWLERTSWG